MRQEKNNISHHCDINNNDNNKLKRQMVIGSSQEIVDMIIAVKDNKKKDNNNNNDSDNAKTPQLIEPGNHNMLIYPYLKSFREIYCQYSVAMLPEDEIVLIATQYDAIEEVKNNLRLNGVDVDSHVSQGSLFVVDAQQGYQGVDIHGIWKLAMSLLSRAKKEGRRGVTWFSDLGSFFNFSRIEDLMQFELWCPQKYEDKMKTVYCYNLEDFRRLSERQKQILFDHHSKSIFLQ